MGKYSGVEDQKIIQRNPFVPAGRHRFEVLSITEGSAFKGYDYVVAELKVLETDSQYKEGDTLSYFLKMQKGTSWLANLKALVCAILDEQNVSEADMESAVSAKNPLRGAIVRCTARLSDPMDPNSFVQCAWVHETLPPGLVEAAAS